MTVDRVALAGARRSGRSEVREILRICRLGLSLMREVPISRSAHCRSALRSSDPAHEEPWFVEQSSPCASLLPFLVANPHQTSRDDPDEADHVNGTLKTSASDGGKKALRRDFHGTDATRAGNLKLPAGLTHSAIRCEEKDKVRKCDSQEHPCRGRRGMSMAGRHPREVQHSLLFRRGAGVKMAFQICGALPPPPFVLF